jgi:hypothetical protein
MLVVTKVWIVHTAAGTKQLARRSHELQSCMLWTEQLNDLDMTL